MVLVAVTQIMWDDLHTVFFFFYFRGQCAIPVSSTLSCKQHSF